MTIATPSIPRVESSHARQPSRRLAKWLRLIGSIILLMIALAVFTTFVIFPWIKTWGATPDEVTMILPGDALVPVTSFESTKAVTISAAPDQIYPWLLQLGIDRGGMYSYVWIENLMGLHVTNIEEIRPDLQDVEAGDFLRFVPTDFPAQPGPGLYVMEMAQNESFILCFGIEGEVSAPCTSTWQFVLLPQADGSTRLILRNRISDNENWQNTAFGRVFMLPTFVMERKMMLTIKELAETLAAQDAPPGAGMPPLDDSVGQPTLIPDEDGNLPQP